MLHLLAQKKSLDDREKEILAKLLAPGSLQRLNLWQKDYMSKDPLGVAIESQNLDFVQVVATNDASLDMDWNRFFDVSSYEFDQVLVSLFTPSRQTEYAKLRQQKEKEEEKSDSRF